MNSTPGSADVSVVFVSYNTRELLREALRSVPEACEVVVVDNASSDGSAEMVRSEFPNALLIENGRNVGFGAANNQGLEAASRPLVLLLNSDARATPGAVEALAGVFRDPEVVAAGGRLVNPDGTLQESAAGELTLWAVFCEQTLLEKAFPRSRVLSPYWQSSKLLRRGDGPFDVGQVMGACLMMRPVERFDERFFLYCEDTELCHRLRRHGRILYVPKARFVHHLGSSSKARWEAVARYNRGKELFFLLHRGRAAWLACLLLDRLGALLRLALWTVLTLATLGLRPRCWRAAGLFLRVLLAPISGPSDPRRAR
ncbi:MAG: glycosyltransferase family 2 protein [Fimbriimonadaceae bacterium]